MNEEELRAFRTRFGIPISDAEIAKAPFYRPAEDSAEIQYIRERRKALGGFVPSRKIRSEPLASVPTELFDEFYQGTGDRKASTTMVFVRLLAKLLRDKELGKLIVPIVPDEARTFGMEGAVPPDRHLLQRRPAVRAGRHGDAAVLQGGVRRPDSRGRHHRSRIDVVVHRRRNRLRHARRQHDSVLHLLFDVRLPAHRRPHLGRCRRADARLHAGRHRRTDDASGRGTAAPGRQQPALRHGLSRIAWPTTRHSRTRSPSSSRTASSACTSIRTASSTTSR